MFLFFINSIFSLKAIDILLIVSDCILLLTLIIMKYNIYFSSNGVHIKICIRYKIYRFSFYKNIKNIMLPLYWEIVKPLCEK